MATIFEDNFNSYADGDLNGQGGWVSDNAAVDIQGVVVKEGAKAVRSNAAAGPTFYKIGTGQVTGTITIYMRVDTTGKAHQVRISEGITWAVLAYISNAGIYWQYLGSGWVQYAAGADLAAWYIFQFYWETSPAKKVKFRAWKDGAAEGSWTALQNPYADWVTSLSRVSFFPDSVIDCYVDYIAENPYTPPAVGRSQGFIFCKIKNLWLRFKELISCFPWFQERDLANFDF